MNKKIIPQNKALLANHHASLLKTELKLTAEIIEDRQYESLTDLKRLTELGLQKNLGEGLIIPLHLLGDSNKVFLFRPDDPKPLKQKGKQNNPALKPRFETYSISNTMNVALDCPTACHKQIRDLVSPLWITDDPIKADVLAAQGQCAVAMVGLWDYLGKKNFEELIGLQAWSAIQATGRPIRIIFDADIKTDVQVLGIFKRLASHFVRQNEDTREVDLFKISDGRIANISDWFAFGNTIDELELSAQQYNATQIPKASEFEFIDEAVNGIDCPLRLIDGRAYAATWAKVKEKRHEGVDKKGEPVIYDPPKYVTSSKLIIVREDGKLYGNEIPLGKIGLEVLLRESLQSSMKWSSKGVKKYQNGIRPTPSVVFAKLTATIDKFIDFHNSLADQRSMIEFISCYILSTWLLDAFDVSGYLWINGERGSGKSNLLALVAQLSYLGYFITPSSTFATIRNMADYRATLAVDDAESLTMSGKDDSNKRELLLSGNRRNATVTLMEPGPDKSYQMRIVKAFAPRAFSAIRVPDPTLASRCIIVPMARTGNQEKGNLDTSDMEAWPYGRAELIDELWAMSLFHLKDLPKHDVWVRKNSKLIGRNLQPWNALLGVAKWLDGTGVPGLYDRMAKLSADYQSEREKLEIPDASRVVIQALCACAISAITANSAKRNWHAIELPVGEVSVAAIKIIEDDELDIDPSHLNNKKIGRILSRLRFLEIPRPGGKGSRLRKIILQDLVILADSHKVEFMVLLVKMGITLTASQANGTTGTNGTNGTENGEQVELPIISDTSKMTSKMCQMCGFTDFWQRSDGDWICNNCHPNPAK